MNSTIWSSLLLECYLAISSITVHLSHILENLRVDNIIAGCDSDETAVAYYSTARAIMRLLLTSEAGYQVNRGGKAADPVQSTFWDYSGTPPMTQRLSFREAPFQPIKHC